MQFVLDLTATPFGFLAFTLVLLAMLVLAVALLASATLRQPRRAGPAIAGGALLALVVASAVAMWRLEQVDLNPLVREPSQLAGAWWQAGSRLDLGADGRYRCEGDACADIGREGLWLREGDFHLVFRPATGPEAMRRLVVRAQHLWLATGELEARPAYGFRQAQQWAVR